MAKIELDDDQIDILGYAIGLALKDQRAKLIKCTTFSGKLKSKKFADKVYGYREHIDKLEQVLSELSRVPYNLDQSSEKSGYVKLVKG